MFSYSHSILLLLRSQRNWISSSVHLTKVAFVLALLFGEESISKSQASLLEAMMWCLGKVVRADGLNILKVG